MTQQQALDILKLGHNAYITGPAGSGKTYLLNQYIAYLKQHEVDVGITASTGIAATHMGGTTIHSWTGMGIKSALSPYDIESLFEKKYLHKRMKNVKVLIIDEVSMLHHFRLDLVDTILRSFKNNNKPFGGIQVVLCGDFFQLPPVSRPGEPESRFAYHSDAWKNADLRVCYLEEQFRQADDHVLSVLNDIRENIVTAETRSHLDSCFKSRKAVSAVDIEPTRLYTHNIDVDEVNNRALEELDAESATYTMTSGGSDMLASIIKKSCLAPEVLRLKKGAKVMFVKNNFDAGYVNGTLGTVVSLKGEGGGPIIRIAQTGKHVEPIKESWIIEEDGSVKAEVRQYPLRLAWAITIHKSQGMSLDAVEVDLSKCFEKGMGYVALSRVRTLAGLTILGMNEHALTVDDEVLEYDDALRQKSEQAIAEVLREKPESVVEKQKAYLSTIAVLGVKKKEKIATHHSTLELVAEEMPLKDIAAKRGMTEQTIIAHLEKLVEEDAGVLGDLEYIRKSIPAKHFKVISEAIARKYDELKDWKLSPVKDYLDKNKKLHKLRPAPGYREIQLVRIFIKAGY